MASTNTNVIPVQIEVPEILLSYFTPDNRYTVDQLGSIHQYLAEYTYTATTIGHPPAQFNTANLKCCFRHPVTYKLITEIASEEDMQYLKYCTILRDIQRKNITFISKMYGLLEHAELPSDHTDAISQLVSIVFDHPINSALPKPDTENKTEAIKLIRSAMQPILDDMSSTDQRITQNVDMPQFEKIKQIVANMSSMRHVQQLEGYDSLKDLVGNKIYTFFGMNQKGIIEIGVPSEKKDFDNDVQELYDYVLSHPEIL